VGDLFDGSGSDGDPRSPAFDEVAAAAPGAQPRYCDLPSGPPAANAGTVKGIRPENATDAPVSVKTTRTK